MTEGFGAKILACPAMESNFATQAYALRHILRIESRS